MQILLDISLVIKSVNCSLCPYQRALRLASNHARGDGDARSDSNCRETRIGGLAIHVCTCRTMLTVHYGHCPPDKLFEPSDATRGYVS